MIPITIRQGNCTIDYRRHCRYLYFISTYFGLVIRIVITIIIIIITIIMGIHFIKDFHNNLKQVIIIQGNQFIVIIVMDNILVIKVTCNLIIKEGIIIIVECYIVIKGLQKVTMELIVIKG
jgi:hypothetical protein